MIKFSFVAAVLCISVQSTHASARFSNLSYELTSEYAKGTINVQIDGGVYSIGLNAELFKRIDGNLWVTLVFSKKINGKLTPLVDFKLDTCKTDPTLADNPIVRMISMEAKKYANFGLMCPYEPGQYTIKDFSFDNSATLMNFIPKGNYHVSIAAHHQSPGNAKLNKVMSLSFYADIE